MATRVSIHDPFFDEQECFIIKVARFDIKLLFLSGIGFHVRILTLMDGSVVCFLNIVIPLLFLMWIIKAFHQFIKSVLLVKLQFYPQKWLLWTDLSTTFFDVEVFGWFSVFLLPKLWHFGIWIELALCFNHLINLVHDAIFAVFHISCDLPWCFHTYHILHLFITIIWTIPLVITKHLIKLVSNISCWSFFYWSNWVFLLLLFSGWLLAFHLLFNIFLLCSWL